MLGPPSFAMIMIELYTGERLFKGLEVHQLMYLARSHPSSPFPQHVPVCCTLIRGNVAQPLHNAVVSSERGVTRHLVATPCVRSTTRQGLRIMLTYRLCAREGGTLSACAALLPAPCRCSLGTGRRATWHAAGGT